MERLCDNWVRVWIGVEGFPQRTRTDETDGDVEYVAAIERRRGMRDSE